MSILARIAAGLRDHGERVAVRVEGRDPVTYAELARLAAETQRLLDSRRGCAIGILGQKTPEAYGALLGTLFSGNHFVPLNPKLPAERLRRICRLAGVKVILADPAGHAAAADLERVCPEIHLVARGTGMPELRAPGDLAYVMFTSGSTGEPKGVMITHANLEAVMEQVTAFCAVSPEDRFSQLFDASFDLSLGEILWCFSAGATLCPLDTVNMATLPAFLARERISIFGCTPSQVQKLIHAGLFKARAFPGIRFSLFCGEKLDPRLAAEWQAVAPESSVENMYGPTEATLYVTRHTWKGGNVPIGRPLPGCEVEVVDEKLAKLGEGKMGELVIRGPQLSPGYLDDPAKTAQAFVALPWYKGVDNRWYRTGDLGFRNAEGELEFRGRRDFQVKVLGQRLELGEVEALLAAACPSEGWAVFPADADAYGSFEALVAVTTARSVTVARSALDTLPLPQRLRPARLYHLAIFPLTAAGKLDRAAIEASLRAGGLEELRE